MKGRWFISECEVGFKAAEMVIWFWVFYFLTLFTDILEYFFLRWKERYKSVVISSQETVGCKGFGGECKKPLSIITVRGNNERPVLLGSTS